MAPAPTIWPKLLLKWSITYWQNQWALFCPILCNLALQAELGIVDCIWSCFLPGLPRQSLHSFPLHLLHWVLLLYPLNIPPIFYCCDYKRSEKIGLYPVKKKLKRYRNQTLMICLFSRKKSEYIFFCSSTQMFCTLRFWFHFVVSS